MSAQQTTRQLWTMPLALSIMTAVGLISALLGDGLWDAFSWVTLAVPVIVCVWFALRKQPKNHVGEN